VKWDPHDWRHEDHSLNSSLFLFRFFLHKWKQIHCTTTNPAKWGQGGDRTHPTWTLHFDIDQGFIFNAITCWTLNIMDHILGLVRVASLDTNGFTSIKVQALWSCDWFSGSTPLCPNPFVLDFSRQYKSETIETRLYLFMPKKTKWKEFYLC
jgi:hypothetical protein